MKKVTSWELQEKGGKWLGAARSWLQHNVKGGDSNTWGSQQTITMTMSQFEELSAEVAATAINTLDQ